MASLLAALGELLAQHLASLALHFCGSDLLAGHVSENALPGAPDAYDVRAQAARNQGNRHGTANKGQEAAKNYLLDRARGLQESNHFLVTPEVSAEFLIIDYA